MAPVTISSIAELLPWVGSELAASDWFLVGQERVDRFAAATGDFHWIHTDAARAAGESPYGGTVAHGFLTLSLLSHLLGQVIEFRGMPVGINYGLNRVRFTGPVAVGSRIRARFTLAGLENIPGGAQITWSVRVEREGAGKPVLLAEWLTRHHQ